ncbi:helix-turn-helix domain-containing protein [Ammoniphilus sp. YIM 78166]|uniref:helix-turn-helix domain-containing protein n=1 Tax=Ammoniphilus sp. YIM 78166 TaxID=1644106 RepID=UPI0010701D53|nr:helix-turn-helix domain-containing protein [Ammoniphilus sp. YIM 78166]
MKDRTISYSIRLMLFGFTITSLPVILLGLFFYTHSSGVVQKNVNAQKELSVAQVQAHVEQILKMVDHSSTHFLGSYTVQEVINKPLDPREFKFFNQLKSELNYLQRMDTGISDITLFSTAGHWFLNNKGIYRLSDVLDPDYVHLMKHPSSSRWLVRENTRNGSSTQASCGQEIQLVKKLPLTAFDPVGMAVITIPACSLVDKISFDSEHESLLLWDENQNVIWTQGRGTLDTAVIREKLVQLTPSEGQLPISLDNQEYTATYRKSDFNGWTYVSLVPKAHLNQQSHGIGWFTLSLCAVLLLLFIFLSWMGSRRMMRPILSLYQLLTDQLEEPAKAKHTDEIHVIGDQVQRLFRTQQELREQLQGQIEQLKTFFMLKLVLGGTHEEEVAESMDRFGIPSDFCHLAVMATEIERKDTFSQDEDLFMFAVNKLIADRLPQHQRMQPIVIGRTQITIMTSHGEQVEAFRRELFAFAEQVQEEINQHLAVPVQIGISLTHQRLSQIPRAYEEAVEALHSRKRFGEQTIIDFADLGENHPLHYFYPFALQKELFDAIKLVDGEESKRLLRRLIGEICENNPHPHDRQFNAMRLFMNLTTLAHSYNIQPLFINGQQNLFDELFSLDLPNEGERWMLELLIEPILIGIEERTEVRHLHVSKEMVEIIHREFETDLSIEACAERLHYNPSYLSTVFKKSMNVPFSVYLSQYRHEMAKKWLMETDMPVKVIAERLRFTNPQNFIRSFRKWEGVPPGKYRELQSQGLQLMESEG